MKTALKVLCLTLILLFATGFVGNFANAEGDQDFTIYNRTGVDISELYVAPSGSSDWGDDILEGAVIKNGGDMEITFDPSDKAANWDIFIRDSQGNELYWEKINLLEVSEVILEKDGYARCK